MFELGSVEGMQAPVAAAGHLAEALEAATSLRGQRSRLRSVRPSRCAGVSLMPSTCWKRKMIENLPTDRQEGRK
jgi:hypothetical protein